MLRLAAEYALISLIAFYSIVFAFIILFSLPYLVKWYDFITPPALTKACESNSDIETGRVVENVEGYFDDSGHGCDFFCEEYLRSRIYKYVEASAAQIFLDKGQISSYGDYNDSPSHRNLVTKPGLYRFTLEATGHPNCHNWEKHRDSFSTSSRFASAEEYCIATTPIDTVTSQFAVKRQSGLQEHFTGNLLKEDLRIYNQSTNETLKRVMLHTFIVTRPLSGGRRDLLFCPIGEAPNFYSAIVNTLRPAALNYNHAEENQ